MARKVTTLPVIEKTVCQTNADLNRVNVDRIVLHTMVGTASGADDRFNNCLAKVSAHYGVLESGEIWHWVDEDWVAYHAGNYQMNQRSIGIEHEDNGNYDGVRPDSLYEASAKLVADICNFYNIPCDRQHILKHNEIIATGCPDALDVERIVRQANDILNPPVSVIVTDPQQKIDCGPLFGVLELQAIRSTMSDQQNTIAGQKATIDSLSSQLQALQNQPPVVPTPLPSGTTTSSDSSFLAWLKSIFRFNAK